MIEVTDIAIAKLIEKRVDSVRLGVTGGGCSGYEYVFVEDEFKDGDLEIDYGKFKFLIDTMSQPFLKGMTLDYENQGLNETFTFQNPNEEASCGCGVSITFNEDIISKAKR
jgi:iron-sulfur cluster assembly accessory protein